VRELLSTHFDGVVHEGSVIANDSADGLFAIKYAGGDQEDVELDELMEITTGLIFTMLRFVKDHKGTVGACTVAQGAHRSIWALRHLHNDQFSTQILAVIPALTVAVNHRCEALRPIRSHRMIVVSRANQ
jgi:hypothetical protein